MAKITLDLNQFKASGVYTVEFDASERVILTTETIRLVIGFSRKGPFNAPVFLRDLKTARKVFGSIDTFLEKRGSYFHRAIETCLQTGPIFALNLLPLNNVPLTQGGDGVQYRSFALATDDENGRVSRDLLASWYNKERFWFPDSENFIAIANNNALNKNRLLHLVNLSQTPMSFIVRKPNPKVQGYALTARDWYGAGNVPEFIYEFDFMEDYFLEVIAVEGNWTDYDALSEDPVYSKYFDKRGIRVNRLNEFLSLEEITTVANFVGSIIPDFTDQNGSNQFIEVLINNSVASTGIFCAINRDALDDYANSQYEIDMVGHNLIDTNDEVIDFLSYNTPINKNLEFADINDYVQSATPAFNVTQYPFGSYANAYVTSSPIGGRSGLFGNVLVVPKPAPNSQVFTPAKYQEVLNTLTNISLIGTNGSAYGFDYAKVESVIDSGSEFRVVLSNPEMENPAYVTDFNVLGVGTFSSLATNEIQLDDNGLVDNTIIYLSAPGFKGYYEIETTLTPGIYEIIPGTVGTPTYASNFVESDLNTLVDTLANFNFYLADINGKAWDINTAGFDDLVVDLSSGLNIVYKPDAAFQHAIISTNGEVDTLDFTSITQTPTAYDDTSSPYINVATTGGSGTGLTVDVVVNGSGTITAITVNNDGSGYEIGDTITISATPLGGTSPAENVTIDVATLVPISTNNYIEAYPGAVLSEEILASRLVDGDIIYGSANTFNYINVDETWGEDFDTTSNLRYGLLGTRIRQYSNVGLTTQVTGAGFISFDQSFFPGGSAYNPTGNGDLLFISSSIENLRQSVNIVSGSLNATQTKFNISVANASKIEVGYFLVNNDINNPKLTRVINKVRRVDPSTGDVTFEIETTVGVNVNGGAVTVFTPINTYADRLHFTNLSGFALNDFHLPGTPSQLWKILSVIDNTNLGVTLASRDIIQFRYIVDTFRFGIEPQMGPKVILSNLAKKRQKCMAILNAPSIKEFIDSTDPRFTDEPDPAAGNPKPLLNVEYISTGGNLTLGPSFRFTLPDEENGAKFIGVFAPFLTYRENNKNIQVPPAADVSNNFIRKFLNGQPYSIVAGPRRGVLSNPKLVGLEHEFTLQDREFLEPFGINPIVTVRNVGIMIYGNQSAFQRTLSAFNNLHVRDLLITVEAAVEDVLAQYLFEFNDAATRLEIKSIVENFLERVRNAGGIFDYLVVMDETNNTPETIDQNFGIIDIGIEPARGMQKFVNRVTVLKTGSIASGGFTIA
jgi:hypothetical protein